ncbi:MAG: hypothetical protein ACO3QQ_04690 [Candidatus Nanopelagicaceae bacterium]
MNRNSDESGSAIAEFVLIATPLFIPALIFFSSMQQSAKEEMTVSTLARQSLRAFITADNLSLGHQRIRFLLDQYQEIENKERVIFVLDNKGVSVEVLILNKLIEDPNTIILDD